MLIVVPYSDWCLLISCHEAINLKIDIDLVNAYEQNVCGIPYFYKTVSLLPMKTEQQSTLSETHSCLQHNQATTK